MKKICLDLDDTLCFPNHEAKDTFNKYVLAIPNDDLIKQVRRWKKEGHEITIFTARRMITHNGDVKKIIDDVGEVTRQWLDYYKVPYDNIIFGKPYYDIIIDDKAVNVSDWKNVTL